MTDLDKIKMNTFYHLLSIVLVVCLIPKQSYTQQVSKIDALNLYGEFLNESIHGLFTAHALLVISNKEVNKYIDLDSYSLNNLTNSEVQSNLFEKSDKENYTTFQGYSPLQLLDLAKKNSTILNSTLANKLNARADKIGIIINRINRLRFEISEFIDTRDLNEKESIYGVYELLEECSSLFEDFSVQQSAMVNDLGNAHTTNQGEIYLKASHFHRLNKAILLNLRNGNKSSVISNIENFDKAFKEFELLLKDYNNYDKIKYSSYIKNRKDSIYQHLLDYSTKSYIPKAYEIYGKDYYYHNQISKRFFNYSGPGYVRHLNELLENLGMSFVRLVEEPLIFKVVYPMKLDELNNLEKESRFELHKKITINNPDFNFGSNSSRPDSNYITFYVSDFNMIDRDTISLFVNGECILKNYCLTQVEKSIIYKIDSSQEYQLEVRAENNGIIYPNTAMIAYRYKGTRKKKRFETYLDANQKITISLIKSKF